ncbi:uncharacterized protein [Lepeophtheirus salmonis]|uniref:uncharacterized protein n=1 Tax=Lepeophtheirus salmonis TaxID=72036 RepID=UPI001AE5B896|nr:uncharacterized protein LOC121132629 [Lepeophtheirus salmonis]
MNAFMSFILFVFVASSNAQLSNYATNNGGGFRGSNDQFGGSSNQDSNGFGQFGSSSNVDQRIAGSSSDLDPISALEEALPGVPGEDYPIYAEVPDTFSLVMDKLKEDSMLIQKPTVKLSTFVLQLLRVVYAKCPSFAPMEQFLTKRTLSAIGGSTLTVPMLSLSTQETRKLLLKEKLLLLLTMEDLSRILMIADSSGILIIVDLQMILIIVDLPVPEPTMVPLVLLLELIPSLKRLLNLVINPDQEDSSKTVVEEGSFK